MPNYYSFSFWKDKFHLLPYLTPFLGQLEELLAPPFTQVQSTPVQKSPPSFCLTLSTSVSPPKERPGRWSGYTHFLRQFRLLQQKYHSLGRLNSRNIFCTVLEAGSPRPGHRQTWCLMRASFLFHRQPTFPCDLMWWKGWEGFLGVPFIRVPVPFMKVPPSWPHQLPKAPPHNTVTSGVRISTHELREHKQSDCSTALLCIRCKGVQRALRVRKKN